MKDPARTWNAVGSMMRAGTSGPTAADNRGTAVTETIIRAYGLH